MSPNFPALFTKLVFLTSAFLIIVAPEGLAEKQPPEIRALSHIIRPGALGGDPAEVQGKYLQVIARMHQTWLRKGFRPAEQVDRACTLLDVTPTRQVLLRAAFVEAYEAANALGLFTPEGMKLLQPYLENDGSALASLPVPTVHKGPYQGKAVEFRAYLSGPENKAYERDAANWWLGVKEAELSPDAQEKMLKVAQNRKAMMDQARAQEDEARQEKAAPRLEARAEQDAQDKEFADALKAAGDQMAPGSSINVRGKVTETPNSRNGHKITMEGEVSNSSALPLRGKLEWFIIGRSPEKKRMLNLGSSSTDLKIMPKAWHKFDAGSLGINGIEARTRAGVEDGLAIPAHSQEPRYLGWIIRVTDAEDKTLAFRTSGLGELDEMAKTGNGLNRLRSQTGRDGGR